MPDEPNPIYNGRTCVYCDPEEQQAQCRTCKDGVCRHAKLRHRTWNFRLTNADGFVGVAHASDASFVAESACCDRLTSIQCNVPFGFIGECPTRTIRSSSYKWRRYTQTFASVVEQWRFCTNPSLGTCVLIGPLDTCNQTIEYVKACVQGWVLVTEIAQVRLFVTRTEPRYNCEPKRCQFRLALVIDGRIGLSWATQITEGFNRTVNSSTTFCGAPPINGCNSGPSANWPVGQPPAFNTNIPVTMHPWRQVWRRSVDHLEFPMTFNVANSVSTTCGPKCAAGITGLFPTFGNTPAFVCDAPPSPTQCVNCFETSVGVTLCPPGSCEDCPSAEYPFSNDSGGQRQTLIAATDSGEQNTLGGFLPNTDFPQNWTVELW
jgi:hypothetical protein